MIGQGANTHHTETTVTNSYPVTIGICSDHAATLKVECFRACCIGETSIPHEVCRTTCAQSERTIDRDVYIVR